MNALLARRDPGRSASERVDGPQLVAEHLERLDRQILELVSGDVDLGAEARAAPRHRRTSARVSFAATSAAQGCVVRVEDVASVAELRRGDAQHPAELAAADDPDRRTWRTIIRALRPPRRSAARASARSRPASASSLVASIAAASSAALIAPALPIASVPTGTPAGIWTIESRLSMPFSAWLSTGTPSTGSIVIDAAMPGRCAAPPAPAMIDLEAALARPNAHSRTAAWACGAPTPPWSHGRRRAARAFRRHGASSPNRSSLPMMMPTSGPASPMALSRLEAACEARLV